MRNVMPSQVVEVIDRLFPHAAKGVGDGMIDPSQSTQLRGLLNLVEAIPAELLPNAAQDYATFVLARSTISETLAMWQSRGAVGAMPPAGGADAVVTLRRILAVLPDEHPPAAYAELPFIPDADLRESIRLDIGAAHRAHERYEWKAATVLAGAAIEALLHWRLSQETKAKLNGAPRAPKKDLNNYVLHEYIQVSEDLGLLTGKRVTAATLAKDYRNLIHPGRSIRLGEKCTRSTSHMAVGAMEAVIEALS